MRKKFLYSLISACVVLQILCSGRFVKREELEYLNKRYSGVYTVIKPVEISHGQLMEAGMKVRLYFRADSESLKVYAYPYNALREEALGKNIMHLFEEDFTDEEYVREVFEKKLAEILLLY